MRQPFDGSFPVTSGYGPRIDPITGAGTSDHWGIDFGLAPFTPLLAVASGTVVVAMDETDFVPGGGFGQTVTILLDDPPPGVNRVGYGHMARIDVSVGQHVGEGEQLGLSGGAQGMAGAGSSTGAHLHLWTGDGPNPPQVTDPTPFFIGGVPNPQGELGEFAYDFVRVAGPDPRQLASIGAHGVLVYSFDGRQSDDYLDECRDLGMKVVWIWEREVDSILAGHDFAVTECREHEASARPGELTYVACDLNNGALGGRDITPFLRGWSETTREPVFGLYGSQDAIAQGQAAHIRKLERWWGVVNWITGGERDNHPSNIAFSRDAEVHIIQLIGSPIDDSDQNLIVRSDWHSFEGSDEEDDVRPIYITKQSDPKVGIWVTDGMWKRHVLPTEWEFITGMATLVHRDAPQVVSIADEWWDSLPVAANK